MQKGKRLLASLLSLVMALGVTTVPAMAAGNAAGEQYTKDGKYYYEPLEQGVYSKGGYTLEKVSHPDRGAGELDSILTPEERGQSYSWSMAEAGDYVYIGTCYNSTYYIYHNNVLTSLKQMQKEGQIGKDVDVNNVANDIVETVFGVDKFDKTEMKDWAPVIMAVNKHTGEAEVVFRERDIWDENPDIFPGYGIPNAPRNYLSGYRMAFEFHGKIYFAGMGTPTATLVEVDPATNETQIVYHNINRTRGVANGVHGLLVYDDEILMCLATDNYDGNGTPGGIIVGSKDPSKGLSEWRVVANQDSFDGLPGVMQIDGLNGGGIWDIIEYNGAVYVTVVTDKTNPETGITNKQGFALYRGDKQADDSFVWTQVAGDHGTSGLPFGLGQNYSMACNMWVFDNHLYLGTYNDPMLDLAAVPASGNFEHLYRDLDHSIYLYRMDEGENFEMIAGKNDNKCFPEGPKGNLGAGLGNNSNQYVWRYGVHNDELYIGTYDTSTLTYMFTQLTDGQVKDMSKEDIAGRADKLQDALLEVLQKNDDPVLKAFLKKTIFSSTATGIFQNLSGIASKLSKDWNPVPKYEKNIANYELMKKLVLDKIQAMSVLADDEVTDIPEGADVDELMEIMSEAADKEKIDEPCVSVDEFIDSLSDKEVIKLYAQMEGTEAEAADTEAVTLTEDDDRALPAVPSKDEIKSMKDQLKAKLTEAVNKLFAEMDKIYYDKNLHNFVYYFGVNFYAQSCEKGFDLLVSKDGINFDAITRNGFGDAENHGLRTIGSTEQGVFLGTANPFQGTQLWRMSSDRDLKLDTDPTAERHNIKVTVKGKGKATASQETAVEGKYVKLTAEAAEGYVFDRWEVVSPKDLEIKDGQFRMPNEDVEIVAHFVKEGTEKPDPEKPDPGNPDNPSKPPAGGGDNGNSGNGNGNAGNTGNANGPKTGDAAPIGTLVLILGAASALAVTMNKKRKSSK